MANFQRYRCAELTPLEHLQQSNLVAKKTTATDALMELIQHSAELMKCKSLILLIWCTVFYFSIRTDVYFLIKTAKTCIFPKKPTRTVDYSAAAVARTSGHPWLQGFLLLQRDGTPLHTKRGPFASWYSAGSILDVTSIYIIKKKHVFLSVRPSTFYIFCYLQKNILINFK